MPKFTSPLEEVRVASPCPADWGRMVGDERVRFCGSCSLHVFNLSGMTRREAEALVTNAEGRLCVRFFRRADGSILTRDCPVGLAAVRRRVARVAGSALSAALGFFAGLGLNFGYGREPSPSIMGAMAEPAPRMSHPPAVTVPAEGPDEFKGEASIDPMQGLVLVEDFEVRGKMAPLSSDDGKRAGGARGRGAGRRQR
jgi:hypothetical protein